ncbi:MAG: NAD(P)-dependent oxidoreductase, partial [Dehalococcoidales bacterium]
LAVAASGDDAVNRAVADEARRSGVLVNVVDVPELSDFIVPSYVRRGDITLAISTAGRSPALARKLRRRLEEQFGEEYGALARLVGEVRAEVRQEGTAIDGETWQAALDIDRLLDLIRSGEAEKARAALLDGLRTRPTG